MPINRTSEPETEGLGSDKTSHFRNREFHSQVLEMKSSVYFLPIESLSPDNIMKLFDIAGFASIVEKEAPIPIKVHFGEPGNTAFLKPANVKPITDKISSLGGKPFLTDANTLYKGSRSNSTDHTKTAISHGFTFAPVIIADGENGQDYKKIQINAKHFKEVNIGAGVCDRVSMFVVSHFKGHEVTGFGGALKNVGMGLGSRSGKQQMHSDIKPKVNPEKCTGCELCTKWCPVDAISMTGEKALINGEKCIGCAECVVACNFAAISISWEGDPGAVQEKIVEYCMGALKGKKCAYFSFLINISPLCDCYGFTDPPIVGDIGVLASLDPIAIDQASVDLTNKKAGEDIIKKTHPEIDYNIQLEYGEKVGLGKRKYEIIEI